MAATIINYVMNKLSLHFVMFLHLKYHNIITPPQHWVHYISWLYSARDIPHRIKETISEVGGGAPPK